jgi:hypothetical protein
MYCIQYCKGFGCRCLGPKPESRVNLKVGPGETESHHDEYHDFPGSTEDSEKCQGRREWRAAEAAGGGGRRRRETAAEVQAVTVW